jgi:conjugative relaxase-like TrwC/TraI family protein
VVLTIHVVRQGGHHYYVHDMVPGRAEDSPVAGEEPGRWTGSGATALGLSGPVDAPCFAAVLEGRDPTSGRALRVARGDRSSAGFDLAFCAPKSVSLLHLLAPAEMARAAGTGHHAAVADALDYLGRSGVGVRRRRHGEVAFLSSTGPVAGEFLHRTSRALDPHLHTHVVLANVAQGVDGVWSSVDSRRLHAHLPAAQAVYHARLRFELGDRMGAAWEVRPSGMGDVIGVDGGLRRLFSQRTASMDEFRSRRPGAGSESRTAGAGAGVSGARRDHRSLAAYFADRPEKDCSVTVDRLMDEWRQRAADLGYDLGDLTRAVGVHRRDPEPVVDPDRLRHRLVELTRDHRSVGHRDVVAAVGAATPGGAVGRDLESVATRLIERCEPLDPSSPGLGLVERSARGLWDPTALVRAVDGLAGGVPVGMVHRSSPAPSARTRTDHERAGLSLRDRRVDGPDVVSRSLGVER